MASATTNSSGIATVGSWTLGDNPGSNTLTATRAGLSGSPVTFTATGQTGPAADIALNDGDNQTRPPAPRSPSPPSVLVTDGHDNPVQGVSVTFAVDSGDGSATGAAATTDAVGHRHGGELDPGRSRRQHADGDERRPVGLAGDLHGDSRAF